METNIETWLPEARGLAAQCWCDEENSGKEMDVNLAESAARRIAAWMETAAFHARNEEFWAKRARETTGRVDALEREALYCKTDYDYLLTITEDKDGLHDWLRMRSARVGALMRPNNQGNWPSGDSREGPR